jgi:hypothetical protein
MPAMNGVDRYPVRFSVDYPNRPLNRVSTLFRLLAAIPVLIMLTLLTGTGDRAWIGEHTAGVASGGVALLLVPVAVAVLVRRKYPRWWFDWNRELIRFLNRIGVYLVLMDDRYPSLDEQQSVHLEIDYPDPRELNRVLPLIKWLLAIPHYVALLFLHLAVIVCAVVAWFAVVFTGRYPRPLFDFVEGVFRWNNRVAGYMALLVTDRYPPFSLRA